MPTSADDVTFDANSGTAATATIDTAANANTITINKSDLTLLHNAGSTVVGAVTLTTGTLNTNGKTCSWGSCVGSGSGVRTLTLGASQITLTAGASAICWAFGSTTNMTLTANTATLTMSGASNTTGSTAFQAVTNFDWKGMSVVLTGSGVPIMSFAGCKLANLTRTGTAAKTDGLTFNGDVTVTGTVTLGGNSTQGVNRLSVQSSTVGAQRTITATGAAVVINGDVDFQDIAFAGSPSWTNAGSAYVGDCQGNGALITSNATAAVDQYRIGAAGNWSDTTHWSTSSGGSANGRAPLPQDNAHIDSHASGTVVWDMPRMGNNIDWTGFTGTYSASVTPRVLGNWTFGAGMTAGPNSVVFGGRGAQTIESNGVPFLSRVTIDAHTTGTYTLLDALQVGTSGAPVGVPIGCSGGGFDDGGFAVTLWNSSGGQVINGSLDRLTMTGTWTLQTGTATIPWNVTATTQSTAASTIIIANASASTRTFAGGGKTFGTLTYTVAGSTGALVTTGANTFANVIVGAGRTVTFPANTVTTITQSFSGVFGTAGSVTTVNSSIPGTAATLSAPAPLTMGCDYLSLQDITATGGAGWYAGPNSTIVSNVSGWTLTAPTITRTETSTAADGVSSLGLGTQGNIGDAATATDAVSGMALGTQGNITDAAAGVDAAASLALTAADAVTGADASWLGLSAADASTLADALSALALSGTGDAAAAADTPFGIAMNAIDAALLTDTVSPLIPLGGIGDAGSVDEMARLFDTLTLYETAAVSEALVLDADTMAEDGGAAVDASLPLLLLLTLADVATGQDGVTGIGFSRADAGALTDSLVSVVVLFTGSRGGSVVSKNRGGSVAAVTRGGEVHA